jgi:hypothetical protein
MRAAENPTQWLLSRLTCCGLEGYFHIDQAMPWANLTEALAKADIDNMSPEAIRTFLDMDDGAGELVPLVIFRGIFGNLEGFPGNWQGE